jgi:hypothetical protein
VLLTCGFISRRVKNLNGERNSKPYDLAIATTLYHGKYVHVDCDNYRLGLFRKLVESIARTRWGGIKPVWCLWDDNSPTKWFPSRTDVDIDMVTHVNSKGPTKSASANVIDCLNEARRLAPYTVVIDSDAIVHPQWVLKAFALIDKYPSSRVWGLYNTSHHPTIDYNGFESDDEEVIFKHTNTVFGTIYRSSERPETPLTDWCESFINELRKPVGVIPVLKKSVIQHTGANGLNNVAGVVEDYDSSFEVE